MISIEKTGEHFRLIYDVKGRFAVHRITAEEAKVRRGEEEGGEGGEGTDCGLSGDDSSGFDEQS